jgi:hypothetical protein
MNIMSNQTGQYGEPAVWNNVLQPNWKETVESWGWKPLQDGKRGYYIGGKCPYCLDDMSRTIEIVETIPEGAIPPPEYVWIQCNCKVAHHPHSVGEGCGQGANISGPRFRV